MTLTKRQLASSAERRDHLVRLCAALPEVDCEPAGEAHTAFRVRRKTFGYHLHDHHDDGKIAFCGKSTKEEQRRLVAEDPARFYVPAYLGPSGWVSLRLDTDRVDWTLVERLVKDAYRAQAPKSLAALV